MDRIKKKALLPPHAVREAERFRRQKRKAGAKAKRAARKKRT